MKRLVIAGVLAFAAGTTSVASADATPRAQLRSFVCQQALEPASRAMSIKAVMRPLSGTMRMAMRFQLLMRTHRNGPAASVVGNGLRTWITPKNDPTLGSHPGDRWVVKHPVVDLAAPAYYQLRVAFRWTDGGGHMIGHAVRQSQVCFQPELRPDLAITGIQVSGSSNHSREDRYVATIENAGRATAGQFEVEFMDGSQTQPQFKAVPQLLAHHSVQVAFSGPACSPSAPATIVADPSKAVDDAHPSNNAMQSSCS